jgi:anti-anti-sigma factor
VSVGRIGLENDGETVVVVLRGEHDISTAPEVRAELDRALESGHDVVVDLSLTEFIDSSILGVLVSAHRTASSAVPAGGGFALVATPAGPVTRLLELVAVSDVMRVYATRAEALTGTDNGAA